MNDFSESINKIYNNPFVLTPVLTSFYKNYRGCDKDILLSYLIFPIVLEKEHLSNVKKIYSSTPLSRFTKDKVFMPGFYDRFKYYQQLTNLCLQYALDSQYISLSKKLRVTVNEDESYFTDPSLKEAIELANCLHKVFKKINIVNIYQAFGIKEL